VSEAPAAPIRPAEVARILSEIGTLMELNGRDAFRARAFRAAARGLEGTDADLAALAREDRLTELPGIGRGIAGVVREIVETGRSTPHEELAAATPIGLFELLRVPGLGTKRIHTLYAELGVDSLDALEEAARAGRIAALPGMGAKTEAKIREGLGFARAARGRRRYPEALEIGVRLLEWLRSHPFVADAALAGPLRRRMEVVDRIDLVAAVERGEPEGPTGSGTADEARGSSAAIASEFFALNGFVTSPVADAEGGLEAVLGDGLAVRLRVVPLERFVAALAWDTGSDAHLAELVDRAAERGLELGPAGLLRHGDRVDLPDESALYTELDLPYLPPELREGLGEVEEAVVGRPPRLVEIDDLTGTFHCHTTYSDGKATLAEMAVAAEALGWSYLGIADHSRAAAYARGLPVERLREQRAEIQAWNAARAERGNGMFRLFHGIESDILPDGRLDYTDDVLAELDYVVGSVHSSFGMSEDEMTARVVRAVRHPSLTVLGHPTGRLLLTREGYALDVEAVLEAAAEAGVVVEINANPHRLDLDWRHVRRAAAMGIVIAINPDAHSIAALEHVAFGVNMARKAGLGPRQILNCWSLEEVEGYFAGRKQARPA
jgi:DNA polymerase (family 10)